MASTALKPTYIFNQYYIDLLKKIKNVAKKHRTQSETAKRVLKSVKDNYQTYDKTSEEYLDFFKNSCNTDFWASYIDLEDDKYNEWLKDDKNLAVEIYKNITLKDVVKLLRNNYITYHYLTVLYIYTNEMSEDDITKILKTLQEKGEVNLDDEANKIENENISKVLKRFLKEKSKNADVNTETGDADGDIPGMDTLKDTTIGKIAKEIIDDIDLTKIKQSINEEGDIFKAISKPDSGFGELFTNVSQKMSNKISSGELSQEAIFKDAMKFASLLPGMLGNNAGGGNKSSQGGGGFDMEAMMNMMSMMNSINGGGGGGGGGGKKAKAGVNNQALKALMKKQQLRQKLNNK